MPVAIITTSGTAAVELHPALVEARFGRVPLLALTADRPPWLRGTGANQTIDQVNLYGTNVKWFEDAPLAAVTDEPRTRAMAARAWAEALTVPAGPVHVNFPFDEPLMPPADLPAPGESTRTTTWTPPSHVPGEASLRSLAELVEGRRGILVAGPVSSHGFQPAITDLARAAGLPILADPLSGVRAGPHDLSQVVAHHDALAQAGFFDREPPEVAVRFGAVPTSKALNSWLASHRSRPYAVVDVTGWRDPGGTAQAILTADPAVAAGELAKIITRPAPAEWRRAWLEADAAASAALAEPQPGFTELDAIGAVLRAVPDPATVWVGSSMPIRQVDLLMDRSPKRLRLLANRGASGIDGFLSSGIGSAVAGTEPTYVVAGDLSTLHDLTALGWAGRHRADVTIVVINNDGGGIFHLLPQASLPEFEELFGTPHGLDFKAAADLFGLGYTRAADSAALTAAVSATPAGPRLVEVRFERSAGAQAYIEAVDRVRRRLATES